MIPIGLVGPFLELNDVLNVRLVCKDFLDTLHQELSAETCAVWFILTLRERNLYWTSKRWTEASLYCTPDLIQSLQDECSTPLDCLMRFMRVLKYIPEEVVVGYSGKYGRVCAPIQQRERGGFISLYTQCSRGKDSCSTCRAKVPKLKKENSGGAGVNQYFSIETKDEMVLDLERAYLSCVPNLPSDLTCPVCRVSDRRTLMLTDVCYQTEPGTEQAQSYNMVLSFTPNEQESPAKKTKRKTPDPSDEYPPKYEEFFIPDKYRPHVPDAKHALSIHCENCRKFTVLGPAGRCSQPSRDLCKSLQAYSLFGTRSFHAAGALVRTKCGWGFCERALMCSACIEQSGQQKPIACQGCHSRIIEKRWL